jgi:GT2 family glycosyltransferase
MSKLDAPEFNIPKYITYAPTCFLYVDASVFEEIGFMDEKYFAYYDDTDFVLRAIRKGIKMWYEPSVYLLHKVSTSSGGDTSPFYIYYGNRNKIYFIRKNFKGIKKLFLLFYAMLTRTVFYLKFDKVGKKNLIKGIKDGFKISLS